MVYLGQSRPILANLGQPWLIHHSKGSLGVVDRIIYAIFNGLNENPEWKNRTLRLFTQAA